MKVFELMNALAEMPAGAEVVVCSQFTEEQANKYGTKYRHADDTFSVRISLSAEQCVLDDDTEEVFIRGVF